MESGDASPNAATATREGRRGWPAMLVRLSSVGRGELRKLLEITWRYGAPKRLIAERDGAKR